MENEQFVQKLYTPRVHTGCVKFFADRIADFSECFRTQRKYEAMNQNSRDHDIVPTDERTVNANNLMNTLLDETVALLYQFK